MSKKTVKTTTAKLGLPKFNETAKIVVLAKGKTNPRRKNTGPFRRYEVLLKSRTVAAFLKQMPKWRSTINRAEKEGFIRVG
jgi:hypothetical protein